MRRNDVSMVIERMPSRLAQAQVLVSLVFAAPRSLWAYT